jgi:hypothetical protein
VQHVLDREINGGDGMKGDAGVHPIQCEREDPHPPHHTPGLLSYCKGIPSPQPRVIFSTIHGSRLYGLATENSDHDEFTVTDSTRTHAMQTVWGDRDSTVVGFNTFLVRALGGSHQSVEALFSPYKMWNPEFEHFKPFIENAVVCGGPVYAKYERTIRKFCFGDFKRRRHAVRLSYNLQDLRRQGRFNPVMSEMEQIFANDAALNMKGEELWTALMK